MPATSPWVARLPKPAEFCTYCFRRLDPRAPENGSLRPSRDHYLPKAAGGHRTVPCCLACNRLKGDMSPDQWLTIRRTVPDWWKLYPGENRRGVRLYLALVI